MSVLGWFWARATGREAWEGGFPNTRVVFDDMERIWNVILVWITAELTRIESRAGSEKIITWFWFLVHMSHSA